MKELQQWMENNLQFVAPYVDSRSVSQIQTIVILYLYIFTCYCSANPTITDEVNIFFSFPHMMGEQSLLQQSHQGKL